MFRSPILTRSLLLVCLTTSLVSAQTTIGSWRMGEADTGATNGGTVVSTLSSVGSLGNLSRTGSASAYSSFTRADIGSTYSVITGASAGFVLGSNLGVNNNFAMEAWVYNTDSSEVQVIFYNGNTALNGFGLIYQGGLLRLQVNGFTGLNNVAMNINEWNHVAAVINDGSISLHLNGVGTTSDLTMPINATSPFIVSSGGGFGFRGYIDEVRAFTFTAGNFNSSMLGYSVIPEPSSFAAFAGAAMLVLAGMRRRRRSSQTV